MEAEVPHAEGPAAVPGAVLMPIIQKAQPVEGSRGVLEVHLSLPTSQLHIFKVQK